MTALVHPPSPYAVGRGLRVGVGLGLVLAAFIVTGHPRDCGSAALGAILVGFADSGGVRRSQFQTMAATALLAAVGLALGLVLANSVGVAVAVLGLAAFGAGYLNALGPSAGTVGLCSAVAMAFAIYRPTSPAIAGLNALALLAGGGVQIALAVLVWPLRPHAAARSALSRAFRAIGEAAGGRADAARARIAPALAEADADLQATFLRAHGGLGRDSAGTRLRVFAVVARQLAPAVVAFSDCADTATGAPLGRADGDSDATAQRHAPDDTVAALSVARTAVTSLCNEAGDRALRAHGRVDARGVDAAAAALCAALANRGPAVSGDPAELAADEAYRRLRDIATLARTLAGTASPDADSHEGLGAPVSAARSQWRDDLGAHWTPTSPVMRHALRLGVTVSIGAALAAVLAPPNPAWIPMTVLFVLRPDYASTVSRVWRRGIGTVIGIVIGVACAFVVPAPAGTAIVAALAVAGMITVFPVDYAAFTTGISVAVVQLQYLVGYDPVHAAGSRVVDTLAGVILVSIAFRLFPTWTATTLPGALRDLCDAARGVVDATCSRLAATGSSEAATPTDAIRHMARAQTTAEAAYQQLRTEPPASQTGAASDLDSWPTRFTAFSRLRATATVLALHQRPASARPLPEADAFARAADDIFGAIADGESCSDDDARIRRLRANLDRIGDAADAATLAVTATVSTDATGIPAPASTTATDLGLIAAELRHLGFCVEAAATAHPRFTASG